ncbi:MAG: nucleotidyltransferase domain-containing protein [Armatimonadota bacterium]
MSFYKAPTDSIIIKHLKILQTATFLQPLIDKLKEISIKIILYGSCATGKNHSQSDIDIFIITQYPDKAEKIIFKDSLREKIQYVIKTPNELIKTKKNNPVFYEELERGILLWEEKRT